MTVTVPPIVSRELRLQCVALLTAITGLQVNSPGAFETAPKDIADVGELKVRTPNERKDSIAKTLVETTTTTTIEFSARCKAATDTACQDALESLVAQIEFTILGAVSLIRTVQQVSSVRRTLEVAEEGELWFGAALIEVDFETFESWDPITLRPDDFPDLQAVGLHLDTRKPFDSQGTYPNPAFPQAVTPAPRLAGPDGRDEIYAEISLAAAPPPAPARRALVTSGKYLLGPNNQRITLRGWNWGIWNTWQPGDARANRQAGANIVRIALRWWMPVAGTDSRLPSAPGGINPAFLPILDAMMADAAAEGLYIQLFIDSNCGQNGTQDSDTVTFCDPSGAFPNGHNFWSDTVKRAEFIAAWVFIANRYKNNPWWVIAEPQPEPAPPTYSDNDIRDFYREVIGALRPVLPGMLFLVGGLSYRAVKIQKSLMYGERDIVYTGNLFMQTGDTQQNNLLDFTTRLQELVDFSNVADVPVFVQQTGITSADDPGNTYLHAMLPQINAAGLGWIWWTYRDISPNGFGVLHYNGSSWTLDQTKLVAIAQQLRASAP